MITRLENIEKKYNEITEQLTHEDVISDIKKMTSLSKEQRALSETVELYHKYLQILEDINTAKEMEKDHDMIEFAHEELERLHNLKEETEKKLEILLLPHDPNDEKNVIVEIRGAAGGDEANIFAGDLFDMYTHYANNQGFKIEVLNSIPGSAGGYAQIEFMVKGEGAYSKLKYESGAHRVQRVPSTESQGRIHTSTATVVVLPEAEEVEIDLADKEIRIDIYHASGAGGQHVNKTASAVRLTHIPTGIAVAMQDERSQIKNREKAMKVLRARVYDKLQQEAQSAYDSERKSAVGTGDRSERIRTYNFPQNRVTDHRIGLTIQKLDQILAGKLDEIVDSLIIYDQTSKLEELQNG